jgi:acetolactate synthase I/III small subunit
VAIIKDSKGFHEKLRDFEYREPGEEPMENEYLNQQAEVFDM